MRRMLFCFVSCCWFDKSRNPSLNEGNCNKFLLCFEWFLCFSVWSRKCKLHDFLLCGIYNELSHEGLITENIVVKFMVICVIGFSQSFHSSDLIMSNKNDKYAMSSRVCSWDELYSLETSFITLSSIYD